MEQGRRDPVHSIHVHPEYLSRFRIHSYIGAALTLVTTFFLLFIDENETDRVLEGRWDGDDEFDDLGESPWWEAEEGGEHPVASV